MDQSARIRIQTASAIRDSRRGDTPGRRLSVTASGTGRAATDRQSFPRRSWHADRVRAGVDPPEPAGRRRSALTRTHRPNNDLWAVDEDLRAVLMLQRRVHPTL